jgi:GT2 family glycosyltransferase
VTAPEEGTPRVSVVIPTAGRPRFVVRAVESALDQSVREIEVLVVIDGPDRLSANALEALTDPRLCVIQRPRRDGPGAARNAGVRTAAAPWVAFLDDDDLWAPEKLALQLDTAEECGLAHPIVACRVAADDGSGRLRTWPRRLPAAGEPLGDYLLARRTPFWGEALIHTSTILVERSLLEEVPFREDLLVHEDMDWLLRANRLEGVGVVFVPDRKPLATWSVDRGRTRASRERDWRESLAWARRVRPLISRRAYAAFVLTWVGAHAARRRDLSALWQLPRDAVRFGRPRPRDFLLFAAVWLVPESLRTRAADAWSGVRPRGSSTSPR